jgi:hypothetical protein
VRLETLFCYLMEEAESLSETLKLQAEKEHETNKNRWNLVQQLKKLCSLTPQRKKFFKERYFKFRFSESYC